MPGLHLAQEAATGRTMRVRRAADGDFEAIRALLDAADLPTSDVTSDLGPFVIAEANETIVGCAGIQRLDGVGLLRSVATRRDLRALGLGTHLCTAIVEIARGEGLGELFLLTTSAPTFFQRLGFSPVARTAVPIGVQMTGEFRELCPESSTVMSRVLTGGAGAHTVALLTAAYERFLAGDPSLLLPILDARVIYHLPGKHLGGGHLEGAEAILRRGAAALRACDAALSATLLGSCGDEWVVLTVEHVVGQRRRRTLDQDATVVWRFAGLQCVEMWTHFDDQRACDAFWEGWLV